MVWVVSQETIRGDGADRGDGPPGRNTGRSDGRSHADHGVAVCPATRHGGNQPSRLSALYAAVRAEGTLCRAPATPWQHPRRWHRDGTLGNGDGADVPA